MKRFAVVPMMPVNVGVGIDSLFESHRITYYRTSEQLEIMCEMCVKKWTMNKKLNWVLTQQD